MNAVKKSFQMGGDLAQTLDNILKQKQGLSFTLLVNEALKNWFVAPQFDLSGFKIGEIPESMPVKKSVNIANDLVEKIERLKEKNPGFNATLIINQALWSWSKNPKISVFPNYSDSDVDKFLSENTDLMDKLAE